MQATPSDDLFSHAARRSTPTGPINIGQFNGFDVERGVPISSNRSGEQRKKWDAAKFPFSRLEVGDCFVVHPRIGEELIYVQNAVSGAASTWARRFAKENPDAGRRSFTTRQQNGCFVRCWRTE